MRRTRARLRDQTHSPRPSRTSAASAADGPPSRAPAATASADFHIIAFRGYDSLPSLERTRASSRARSREPATVPWPAKDLGQRVVRSRETSAPCFVSHSWAHPTLSHARVFKPPELEKKATWKKSVGSGDCGSRAPAVLFSWAFESWCVDWCVSPKTMESLLGTPRDARSSAFERSIVFESGNWNVPKLRDDDETYVANESVRFLRDAVLNF